MAERRAAKGRWAATIAAVAALACLATGLRAAPDSDEVVGVPAIVRGAPSVRELLAAGSGQPVILFHYFDVGPSCAPTEVTIRVVSAPAHGSLAFEDGEERPYADGHPLYAAADPRHACNDRLAPTKDAVYTAQPGYSGRDEAVVEVTEAGVATTDTIEITVLSLAKPVSTVKTARARH
ncbi:MAG TPA: hypothetical protein VGG29_06665 [Caulobacteraceae bacterium]|jgi:hypothetical protein